MFSNVVKALSGAVLAESCDHSLAECLVISENNLQLNHVPNLDSINCEEGHQKDADIARIYSITENLNLDKNAWKQETKEVQAYLRQR